MNDQWKQTHALISKNKGQMQLILEKLNKKGYEWKWVNPSEAAW